MDGKRKRAVLEKFSEVKGMRFRSEADLLVAEEMDLELFYVLEVQRHIEPQVALARYIAGDDISETGDQLLRTAIETAYIMGWTRGALERVENLKTELDE